MSLSMKVVGIERCIRNLAELPRRIQNKHMRIALNAGGGVIKQTVVSLAPSKHLKRHQIVKVKQKRTGEWFAAIGTKRGKTIIIKRKGLIVRKRRPSESLTQVKKFNISRIAHLLDKGTRRHEVTTNTKRTLATPIDGIWQAFGRRVFVSAKPTYYMERSAAIAGPPAQAKAVAKLNQGIMQEAAALLK
jgi:hypothetical protein